jgi:hypothetical protein
MRFVVFCVLLLAFTFPSLAQAVRGEVVDGNTGLPVEHVSIQNVHSKMGVVTPADGRFFLSGSEDELLEFKKLGYKTVRIRLQRVIPPYFKIIMTKAPIELPEFELARQGRSPDYKSDSLKYSELYQHVLDFPQMSGVDKLRSPFSALSKSNRQKWAFQENYAYFQSEKYIDYTFNDALITQITGFTGDTLLRYKQRYRPSYQQLRGMNEYNFFLYIKESAARFRRTFSRGRNAG